MRCENSITRAGVAHRDNQLATSHLQRNCQIDTTVSNPVIFQRLTATRSTRYTNIVKYTDNQQQLQERTMIASRRQATQLTASLLHDDHTVSPTAPYTEDSGRPQFRQGQVHLKWRNNDVQNSACKHAAREMV